ncbi:FG-GAP repeat protein [Steroidobacter flavus]|uniref:FG-GAP repeat protein n=1 Tax=Steroidobacter flavus TaxID=1842136 RepID=A0ABV8SJQ5_9GAMM
MRAVHLARVLAVSLLTSSGVALAAEPLILEDAKLVPTDGSPQGRFGNSVAIDGDVAVVGATDGASMPEQSRPGAAYVFERQSNGTWRQTAKLLPATEDGTSNFGTSVAVEGDVIVVGCYFSPLTAVFERQGGVWTRVATLGDTGGVDVGIRNGTIITSFVEGADLYQRGANGWAKVQRLQNGVPQADADYVGPGVAIADNYAIHGSYGVDETTPGSPSGTAYIYTLGANHTWTGAPPTAITRPNGGPGADGFSSWVDIDGSTAIIAAVPFPFIFQRNAQGVWNPIQTIEGAASISGNTLLAGAPLGFVRAYRRTSSGTWTHQASLASSTNDFVNAFQIKGSRAIGGSYDRPGAFVFTLPATLRPNPPLVQEDLEDGTANGWVAQPNSTFFVASADGTRAYRQTNTASGATSIYQSADWDRQSIQADITPRAYATGTGDRWFGLMVRYTDPNNYYYITVRNSNTVLLRRIQNGVVQTLATAPLQVVLNRPYPLRLESHGQKLRVLSAGREILSVFDSALTHGRPGVTMYRTQADYDNLILNPDPSRILKDENFNSETIRMDWDYANYAYQWVKLPNTTVFTQPSVGGGAYMVAGPTEGYANQSIRARMRATQFSGADRWFGLIGRYVDASNYYYITVRSSNNISLRKLANGVATTLDTAAMPVALNTWYNLRLDIVGNKLRAYVDERLVLEATDASSPHAAGRYGVGSYKTAAEADDFLAVQP